MSRIDEALKRIRRPGATEPESSDQHAFIPAWTLPAGDRQAKTVDDHQPKSDESLNVSPAGSAGIISFSNEWRERLAGGPDGDPTLIEQFRRLAATLHHAQQNNGIRSIMVTSASQGDGKTLTAVNLALVLAESYRYNVLLVDADLRRPSIPSVVDLGDGNGLSEVLRASSDKKLALVSITPRLTLLPAGQPIANSIEALTSPRMRQILDEAVTRFDWVILDAPPVGPTTDARLLTQMVGGTLFVIHAGHTQHADVQKAIDGLGRDQILGVVLNGVELKETAEYYGTPPVRPRS